jgi:hypothetical protein
MVWRRRSTALANGRTARTVRGQALDTPSARGEAAERSDGDGEEPESEPRAEREPRAAAAPTDRIEWGGSAH